MVMVNIVGAGLELQMGNIVGAGLELQPLTALISASN